MADIPTSDLTIGAEFTDILSSQLLVVPDVQFVFARWMYAAAAKAQMGQMDAYNLAQLQMIEGRVTDVGNPANTMQAMSAGMGGPLQLAGANMAFPDMFVMVREAAGPGTTIKLDRPRFIDGLTTEANRRLSPAQKLFGNTQPITRDQVDVTIYEIAGPGDSSANVTPVSISLFAQARAKHDLLMDIGNQLRRDRYKYLDDVVINRLIGAATATTNGITRGADAASNAAFTGGGNEPMTIDLVLKAVEQLKVRGVPGIANNGQYVMALHPHQIQQLKNDPAYKGQAQFFAGYNILFPGYAGTIENCTLVESQRLPTVSNLGAGAVVGWQGLVIAPQCLGWALSRDAWVARDKNDDGGRFAKFAWMAHEGYQVTDSSFVQLLLTT